nr:hypothetical protein [Chromobacterium sp. ASV5]
MSLQQRLDLLKSMRRIGYGGGRIAMHRAMRTERFNRLRWGEIIGLPVLFNLLTFSLLPSLLGGWFWLTRWSNAATGNLADVSRLLLPDVGPVTLALPWLEMASAPPSFWQCWFNALACLLLLLLSFLIDQERMPTRYLLRLLAIIHGVSCLYFGWMPAAFSHSLEDYHISCLEFVLALLLLTPWVHALAFYVLDKPIWHKLLLTALSMAYLCLEAPLHYFAASLALHYGSLLYMPLLFILGSLMVEVMMLIALYGWAMSWGEP